MEITRICVICKTEIEKANIYAGKNILMTTRTTSKNISRVEEKFMHEIGMKILP